MDRHIFMGQQGNRLMTEVAGVGDKTEGSKMWKLTQPGRSPFCALCVCVCVLLYDVVVNVSRCVRVALCLCECEEWWGWIWGDGGEQYRMFFLSSSSLLPSVTAWGVVTVVVVVVGN